MIKFLKDIENLKAQVYENGESYPWYEDSLIARLENLEEKVEAVYEYLNIIVEHNYTPSQYQVTARKRTKKDNQFPIDF